MFVLWIWQEPKIPPTWQLIQNLKYGVTPDPKPKTFESNTSTSSCSNLQLEVMDMIAVGPALNTNGKPRARRGSATDPQSIYARVINHKSSVTPKCHSIHPFENSSPCKPSQCWPTFREDVIWADLLYPQSSHNFPAVSCSRYFGPAQNFLSPRSHLQLSTFSFIRLLQIKCIPVASVSGLIGPWKLHKIDQDLKYFRPRNPTLSKFQSLGNQPRMINGSHQNPFRQEQIQVTELKYKDMEPAFKDKRPRMKSCGIWLEHFTWD